MPCTTLTKTPHDRNGKDSALSASGRGNDGTSRANNATTTTENDDAWSYSSHDLSDDVKENEAWCSGGVSVDCAVPCRIRSGEISRRC